MPGFQIAPAFLFDMIGPVAVNTTVVETSILGQVIGQRTLPPNFLFAGNCIRLRGKGIFSASGATTKIFKVKIGAAVFTFATYTASGALSNRPFDLFWEGTLQLGGASGTMWGWGSILLYEVASAAPLAVTQSATTATAIDTTVSALIDITATEGTSSATDSITLQQCECELLI